MKTQKMAGSPGPIADQPQAEIFSDPPMRRQGLRAFWRRCAVILSLIFSVAFGAATVVSAATLPVARPASTAGIAGVERVDFTVNYGYDANGNRRTETGSATLTATIGGGGLSQMTMPSAGGAQALSSTATGMGSGGTAPYTYAWSQVSGTGIAMSTGTTATFASSCSVVGGCDYSGVFRVTVTDATSATATATVQVEHHYLAAVPTVSVSPNTSTLTATMPASGVQQSLSAAITATVTNGVGPFVYEWTPLSSGTLTVANGATNQATFSSVCSVVAGCDHPATYQVTATDALGRSATAQVVLDQKFLSAVPQVAVASTNYLQLPMLAAGGSQSLSAAVPTTVTNGQAPFSYQWTLVSGFGFTVANGTTSAPTFSSTCSASPAVGCDDVATYRVTVTDALGRTATAQAGIEQKYPPALQSISVTPSSSFTQMTMPTAGGTQSLSAGVTVGVVNGQAPFTYQWSPTSGYGFTIANAGTSTPTFSSTCSASPATGCDNVGSYQLTVTDALGRAAVATASFEQKYLVAVPSVSVSADSTLAQMTMPPAYGAQYLGTTLTANITNGVAPFTYQWSLVSGTTMSFYGGATTGHTAGLITGCGVPATGCDYSSVYQVVVTDALGRTGTAQIAIEQRFLQAAPATVSISPGSIEVDRNTTGAAQSGSATATATPSGGMAPYTYSWSVPAPLIALSNGTTATATFSMSCGKGANCIRGGPSTVSVTDALGHVGSAAVSVIFDMENNSN